jgi:mono/diheme cytochrome c family protein
LLNSVTPDLSKVLSAVTFATQSCDGIDLYIEPQNLTRRRNDIMKTTKLVVLVMTIAMALFILMPSLSWAEDGGAIYKAKCAMCHGADAAGKPAAKIPSLIGDDAKKLSDADLTAAVTGKAKHPAGVKSLPADDVKAVVTYVRSLQK